MTKQSERDELARLMAASRVKPTVCPPATMDDSLSASFKAKGIDKKSQKPNLLSMRKKRDKKARVKRNWELQRRYDEQHGTVNGYDPQIEARNDFHRNEMGD